MVVLVGWLKTLLTFRRTPLQIWLPMASGDPRKGALKQRLGIAAADASAAEQPNAIWKSRSLRQRVAAADHATETATLSNSSSSSAPLNAALRRDWAKGILPSNRVLEYSAKAGQQGASGVLWKSLGTNEKNAHRNLVSALGYPKTAPDITYLEIPGPDWKQRVHPII